MTEEQRIKELKIAINSAATDPNVRSILKHLRVVCGMDLAPLVMKNDGEIAKEAVLYNVARMMVYHDFKKMMTAETENAITRRDENA